MSRIFIVMFLIILTLFCGLSFAQAEMKMKTVAQTDVAPSSYLQKIDDWYAGLPDGQKKQMVQSVGIALIVVVCFVLFLVGTRRVVFYYDHQDAFWSVAIFLFPMIGFLIVAMLTPENATAEEKVIPTYLTIASFCGSGLACGISVWNSIKYNSSIFIGLIVGVLKILMGFLMLLTIFGMFATATDNNRTKSNRALTIAIFVLIFGLFWKLLVNGYAVEQQRQLKSA
ncbi:hypothetical protein MZ018_14245 [Shewanella sp. JNE10-2]|uniref:hypothetical protein n=1 Tax=unclassified Shewanella TaxID=196818 RepID=UPI0020043C85|nr:MULTISPECIES: hypothetical protein [unclassified Shewanella]MCK7628742.1 hypothetical protein [Shewanella sp. JNE9-1]MCK7643991.1 hypothetical protein [Shewanella sp. JNE3-1]MCK7652045.1 hypothetical protein [Shewanella sp. JNE4-1]UPO26071.1 hypothetical protein MZ018_14245 [Shewanella sp. JNE10-2]UPO37057.1 hypothetical protein MZ097_09185 [Shewanella sp. JNE7]